MNTPYIPAGRPVDLQSAETWCQCGAIWRAASRLCHCARCHKTFTGLAGFDAHQITTCDRCTINHPCPHGNHFGRWSVSCRTGTTGPAEIAADASGRHKAPGRGFDTTTDDGDDEPHSAPEPTPPGFGLAAWYTAHPLTEGAA